MASADTEGTHEVVSQYQNLDFDTICATYLDTNTETTPEQHLKSPLNITVLCIY